MSDRFTESPFPYFIGLKIADLSHFDYIFHFQARLRTESSSDSERPETRSELEFYHMFNTCSMEQREGTLERYSLVETSALTAGL